MHCKTRIVPNPLKAEELNGAFALTASTVIAAEPAALETASYLSKLLCETTGLDLKLITSGSRAPIRDVILLTTENADTSLGEEGYDLEVSEDFVVMRAPRPAGLFYAVQTLRQLLYSYNPLLREVPCVRIYDKPTYGWRGFMLDSSRHFQTKDFILKIIHALASLKINVFHWHVVDSAAWRLEIEKYPQLLQSHLTRDDYTQDHGYYTQSDVREIVDLAKSLHMTIMPEIEMPGHSLQAVAAIPGVICQGPDGNDLPLGSAGDFCLGSDKSIAFLQDVLTETMRLFPNSPYIHIGGDEATDVNWSKCPRCRAKMKEIGTDNPRVLQKWFMEKMAAFVHGHGRTSVAWAENLELGIPEGQIVHGWHEGESEYAVQHGFRTIHGTHEWTYFNYPQGPDEPRRDWMPELDLKTVYRFDPASAAETPEQKALILGSQAHLWTVIVEPDKVSSRTFPRLPAFSEVVWTPEHRQDYGDFLERVDSYLAILRAMGIEYYH